MGKRIVYKDNDNKRVPSVTTVISRYKDSGGLLHWSNKMGLEGKTLEEAQQPAAQAGTFAHELAEAHLNNWPEPEMKGDPDVIEKARNAFSNYLKWEEQSRLTFKYTEVSLVSETHRFGGRMDAVGEEVDGKLAIVDFKTSKLYADHLYQLAAYKCLWDENFPDNKLTGGAHLISFKRETGDFQHSYFDTLEDELEVFLTMRRLYDMCKAVEKRV